MTDRDWDIEENPIPPAPSGSTGAARAKWIEKTFPIGSPVVFRGTGNIVLGDWPVPDGAKGEVIDNRGYELKINLFPPLPGDPRFRGLEDKLSIRIEDLDIYVSYQGAMAGFVEPLTDTWGDEAKPTPRYRLPYGQKARMKPNADGSRGYWMGMCAECGRSCFEVTRGVFSHGDRSVDSDHECVPDRHEEDQPLEPNNVWRKWSVVALVRDPSTRLPSVQRSVIVDGSNAEDAKRAARYEIEKADPGMVVIGFHDVSLHRHEQRVQPNKRARPLKGAAMSTSFGSDLEDVDSIGGGRGRHLDSAMDRYETFHAKAPIRVAELDHDLPTSWIAVGEAIAVMYRTDKWKKDGTDIDYKHLHDKGEEKPYEFGKGVKFYEPASEAKKSTVRGRRTSRPSGKRPQRLAVGLPKAVTLLGYCLGIFVKRYDDEEIYEVNPRGCYLFSSPSGNMLALYSPDEQPNGSSGFLAAMAGGNLRVLKDGIDG